MHHEFQLEISRPDRDDPQWFPVPPGVYSIGSDDDCKIRLQKNKQVDPRHAVLIIRDTGCSIEDLSSQYGTRVGDRMVIGHENLPEQAPVHIGPFTLRVHRGSDESAPAEAEDTNPPPPDPGSTDPAIGSGAAPETDVPVPRQSAPTRGSAPDQPAQPAAASPDTSLSVAAEQRRSIKQQIHKELVERMDIRRLSTSRIRDEELRQKAETTIRAIVEDVAPRLPANIDSQTLVKEIFDEAVGLGPLETLLADETVTEIMVNGYNRIYVERFGKLERVDTVFMDNNSVRAIIERIVSPIGRRIDESQPYVDARLADGSRVNAIIHPLSLVGPCVTIRKFSKTPFTDQDLVRFGTLTPTVLELCKVCVLLRSNIVVSGGTGSGKTSLLNVLSGYIPTTERIVTIEDAAELRLSQDHVVRLESRPPNIEGKGAITIRDLVRNALRMRPDRIVVGECRGGEALDMLQAMNTGHDGSLTTVHANSPRDVISRLETMVLMSGMDLPVRAIREQIAAAVDLIVHESRFSDGSRKITRVTEVCGLEGDQITMQDIFEFKQTGITEDGHVQGRIQSTGAVPTFIEKIHTSGLKLDRSIFDPHHMEEVAHA